MLRDVFKFFLTAILCLSLVSFAPYKAKHAKLAINPISKESEGKITSSSSCYTFQVSQGDCYETKEWSDCKTFRERAELVDYNKAPLEEEVEYRYSIMLPMGYQSLSVKQILGQWHNDVYGPTLSVRHLNGVVWLDLMLENNKTTKKFPMKKLEKGVWNSLVFKIIWSGKERGKIKVWQNSKKIISYNGPTMDQSIEKGPYFRFGLYRSHLYRILKPSWPTQSVLFCDVSSSF